MKKNLSIILTIVAVVVLVLAGTSLYKTKKNAESETKKQTEISKLQELNVNITSDDIEDYQVLGGDYGGFTGDGNTLVRFKLKESSPLDKLFAKDTKDEVKKENKHLFERRSNLTSKDIEQLIGKLKKSSIDDKMYENLKKEGFVDKERQFAYEKEFKDDTIYKVGILSYNQRDKEILLYYESI